MKSTTRYLGAMAKLKLVGSAEAIRGTAGHPIFSLDRGDYVPLGDLQPGEHVRTADGWAIVESLARSWGCETVHNLEVDAEHRYFVGAERIESHNAGGCKTYQTYTRTHPQTGQVYSGRTSGVGLPEANIAARGRSQQIMNAQGFADPVLDRSSTSKAAIRGREQQLIDRNGGAQSDGGTSANVIRGVSTRNPNASRYEQESRKRFGP